MKKLFQLSSSKHNIILKQWHVYNEMEDLTKQ